ncbi:hypothetical protein Xen7305DRAFT_00036270 [Xenococcus sp. PCC 7305]|uniref:hypothetical protein n=1 Tax=Xenococcus sp. PCC 7305 TaxID=102125 RepID=UPI0002AC0D87|nr:hypothetical protein [Xenococcus sp. PCC 7305]ELS03903.1 hypothetical protein Xen7305DRAFT_00036270 [Xenococcus sp. PCC 7305]
MSQSNLIKGLLFSSLIWTLSSNFSAQASVPVISNPSSITAKQVQILKNGQDVLQGIEILQQKAENFRQTVDSLNFQLQAQFNSSGTSNVVDTQLVLTNWQKLNRIWLDFTTDIEKNSEFSHLLQKEQVFTDIEQNLRFQKTIISNLAKVLNQPSASVVIELQGQIFTNQDSYNNSVFDTITQHKFSLISTNKARELELQVSQLENIVSDNLLDKVQTINSVSQNVEASKLKTRQKTDISELTNNSSGEIDLLNFNVLTALALLSSCAIFVALKSYKNKRSFWPKQDLDKIQNPKISDQQVVDYLHSLEAKEQQSYQLIDSANKLILDGKKTLEQQDIHLVSPSSNDAYRKQIRLTNAKSSTISMPSKVATKQVTPPESSAIATTLTTEEELIIVYREHPQLLLPKVIEVEVYQGIGQETTNGESEILFREAKHGNYWIILEPKLENNSYFLVPNPMLDLEFPLFQSSDKIFTCPKHHGKLSGEFDLKFSAMVQVYSSRAWKLIGTGEITFS